MFSMKEKQFLAAEIEKLLLGLNHPEMPTFQPKFALRVVGKESWSWADIQPNWTFASGNEPKTTAWNETARVVMSEEKI